MSRPPLFPETSASGIIQDPNTQQRVIPASVRADGSVRKERRIKPGFIPQEDVTRFRSSRQLAAANARRIVPGSGGPSNFISVPASAVSPGSSASSTANLSKAAKKNAKRKAARASAGVNGGVGTGRFDDEDDDDEEEEEDVPDAWDSDDAPAKGTAVKTPGSEPRTDAAAPAARPPASALPSDSASTPPAATAAPAISPSPSAQDADAANVDPAKRAKAIAKKIRAAEALREKADKGETLLPEQQAKVDSLDALAAELSALGIKD